LKTLLANNEDMNQIMLVSTLVQIGLLVATFIPDEGIKLDARQML